MIEPEFGGVQQGPDQVAQGPLLPVSIIGQVSGDPISFGFLGQSGKYAKVEFSSDFRVLFQFAKALDQVT